MYERQFVSILQKRINEKAPFMQFVLGPRQVGKTTGLEQLLAKLKTPYHFVFVEGELHPDANWLRLQWQKALLSDTLLVVDEIQKVENWNETLKSLWDQQRNNKKLKCIFLGSSTLNLVRGLSESLAGRIEIIPVFHWNYLESKQIYKGLTLDEFLEFGGYPKSYEYLKEKERFNSYVTQSIVKNVIEKDILLNHNVKKPALFKQTVELLAQYPSQEISYTKLLGQLQEGGNVEVIKYYIQLLKESFLFYPLEKYSPKGVKTKASSPKILPACPALVSSLSEQNVFHGHLFEMIVGNELLKCTEKLYYWRDGQYEVDFVAVKNKKLFAIEVKSGKSKHSKSLEVFLTKHPKAKPILVDKDIYLTLCENPDLIFEL